MSQTIPMLPSHIKTLLITGAGGYVGREVASLLCSRYSALKLVLTDVRAPTPSGQSESVAADLSEEAEVVSLFSGRQIDAVSPRNGTLLSSLFLNVA